MLTVKNLISPKTDKFLLGVITDEMYASHLYHYVSNKLQSIGFFGAQKFFAKESESELGHFNTIAQFYNDMGSCAPMPQIVAINAKIETLGDALIVYYDAEYKLLMKYEEFYIYAKDSDVVTAQFVLKFLEIQRESVGEAGDLIARYNQSEGNKGSIMMLDDYMSDL